MTKTSTFSSSTTLALTLSLGLSAAPACGGSDDGTGSTGNAATGSSTGGSGGPPGPAGSNPGGSSSTGATGSTAGSSPGGNGSAGATGSTCEAGSAVQGGGVDSCPALAWRCVDQSVGSPSFHLLGAECSAGHTGNCCNHSDKCLTQTDGSAAAQSAVEVAIGPCQAGCIANPSAQACLDCINSNLVSAGKQALSSGCGTCWTNVISCSFTNCLTQCVAGATAPACRQCAFQNCIVGAGKFNECSGLITNGGL